MLVGFLICYYYVLTILLAVGHAMPGYTVEVMCERLYLSSMLMRSGADANLM